MINGQWFLEKVEDKIDLENFAHAEVINAREYRELKRVANEFVSRKYYAMMTWNKKIAITLRDCYKAVLKRMEMIENEEVK